MDPDLMASACTGRELDLLVAAVRRKVTHVRGNVRHAEARGDQFHLDLDGAELREYQALQAQLEELAPSWVDGRWQP